MNSTAVRRAWIFMVVALGLYAWALSALATGPGAPAALARLLGIGAPRPAHALGWVLAAMVTIVFCWQGMRAYPLIRVHVYDWSAMKAVAVVFALASGICEEFWFRRLPMDWAQAHKAGALAQIVLAALTFGAVHAVWGIAVRNLRIAAASMVATGLLGAGLAVVYLAAGRVLAPCIWSHALINIVLEPWLLVAAMSRGLDSQGRLFAK